MSKGAREDREREREKEREGGEREKGRERGERERERSRERRRERRERGEGSLCCLLGQTGMHTCIQKRVMSSELEGQGPQGGGGR